jgi:O-antigen ligase
MLLKISKVMFVIFLFYIGWFTRVFIVIPRIPLALGVGMIVFMVLHKYSVSSKTSLELTTPVFIWLLFSFYILISGFFVADSKSLLINSWSTYVQILAMVFYIINVSAIENDNKFFLKTYLIYSLVYMTTMLVWGYEGRQGRLYLSASSNPNGDAITLFLGIFCILLLLDTEKTINLVLSLSLVGLLGYTIILTGSRKSFMAVLAYLFLWFISAFKQQLKIQTKNKKILIIFILVIVLVIVRALLWAPFVESVLYSRLTTNGYNIADSESRSGMYREAIQFFRDNPLWGIGFNHYRLLSTYRTYSHSTYAEIISTTGVVGTVIYFSAYIVIIYNLLEIFIKKKGTMVSIVSIQYLALMIVMLALGTGVIHFYNRIDHTAFALMISFYYTEKLKMNQTNDSMFERR